MASSRDGHRTVALVHQAVTTAQVRRQTNYNQTSMGQDDRACRHTADESDPTMSATPMRNCFKDQARLCVHLTAEQNLPGRTMNRVEKRKGQALHCGQETLELNLEKRNQADEDKCNEPIYGTRARRRGAFRRIVVRGAQAGNIWEGSE